MNINLAENIRIFRKQHSLTQEQLAEALGVTAGAVYKWEAGRSVPDLSLIVEMADFFDLSVDVLLGCQMKDNRQEAMVLRLEEYFHDRDASGITEAEKALKKYPNSFKIVYTCASLYHVFGLEQDDKGKLLRALELLEHARRLLDQNKDPEISEMTIYGDMAAIYLSMDESEQAVELLRKNNSSGIYSDQIGFILASYCKRSEEALTYLSEALLNNVVSMIRIVTGYLNVFFERKEYRAAEEMLLWSSGFFNGLREEGRSSFIDKLEAIFYACLAKAQMESGNTAHVKSSLYRAKRLAEAFDAAPDYDANRLRFISAGKRRSVYDNLVATAMDGIRNIMRSMGDESLSKLWEEINIHEE